MNFEPTIFTAFSPYLIAFSIAVLLITLISRFNRTLLSRWNGTNNIQNDLASYHSTNSCNDDRNNIADDSSSEHESDADHVPYTLYRRHDKADMIRRSSDFYSTMNARRSVRFFSEEPVAWEIIANIIRTAGEAILSGRMI